ncbi:MAG: tetratricopeptide repeat protein [Planctomycetes bacterium]|nr:tetratricopeptide repeat protein [Planctomycetota bacterium]
MTDAGARTRRWPVVIGLLIVIGGSVLAWKYWPGSSPVASEIPDFVVDGMEPTVAQALRTARQAVIDAPASATAWFDLAAVLDAHEMNEQAIPFYEHALAIDPQNTRTRYNYALALELVGRSADSEAELQRLVAARPDYAPTYFRWGELCFREGRNEEAVGHFRKVLDLLPSSAIAGRRLGQALLAVGRPEDAIPILEKVRTVAPEDRSTLTALAQALARNGRREEAAELQQRLSSEKIVDTLALEDSLRLAVTSRAIDYVSCMRRASALEAQGDYPNAIRELETAAIARPELPHPHDRIGRCYLHLKQPRAAMPYFDRAVAVDPGYANGYNNRAYAHLRLGEREQAVADLRRALLIDPSHEQAAAQLKVLGETP